MIIDRYSLAMTGPPRLVTARWSRLVQLAMSPDHDRKRAGFVVLHVGAALYHQVIRNDGLLARMSFGRA
jgi:hypothetical protein